jgi:hypothetical protein
MRSFILGCIFCFAAVVAVIGIRAQSSSSEPASANPSFAADYPLDRAGVFIRSSSWNLLANQFPVKTRAAHGIAASLSYGLVPAKVVAEYAGQHAPTSVGGGRPTVCICHMVSLPGEPVIVRLHVKKDSRELDGGRMIVYPIVGGSKMADANKSDLILVDQEQPDSNTWLIRPQSALPPGEYALMLGTQNLSIYPFTVTEPAGPSTDTKANP